MPSQKILTEKQAQRDVLKQKIQASVAGVIVDYKGINVADDTKLRAELRAAGVEYTVVKNTMLHYALEGTGFESLEGVLEGTTALALSKEDPVAAARILQKVADKPNTSFGLKGGFMEGRVLDAAAMAAVAKLPGREGLLSMFAGALTSTLSGLAVAMQAYADKQNDQPAA